MRYSSSERKTTLVKEFLETPFVIGDRVVVTSKDGGRTENYEITSVNPLKGRDIEYKDSIRTLKKEEIVSRWSRHIGANPFIKEEKIRSFSFPLESIMSQVRLSPGCGLTDKIKGIDILEYNTNPIVYVNGIPKTYQRDFCWTISDKQNLIESIYNNVDCGMVIVRLRSLREISELHRRGEVPSFRDIVDGKQRLEALRGFMFNEYQDSHGNLFSDLSDEAQYRFWQSRAITYSEISEDSSDDLILRQFLKMNFCGKPQSPEHLEYVSGLYSSSHEVEK